MLSFRAFLCPVLLASVLPATAGAVSPVRVDVTGGGYRLADEPTGYHCIRRDLVTGAPQQIECPTRDPWSGRRMTLLR